MLGLCDLLLRKGDRRRGLTLELSQVAVHTYISALHLSRLHHLKQSPTHLLCIQVAGRGRGFQAHDPESTGEARRAQQRDTPRGEGMGARQLGGYLHSPANDLDCLARGGRPVPQARTQVLAEAGRVVELRPIDAMDNWDVDLPANTAGQRKKK